MVVKVSSSVYIFIFSPIQGAFFFFFFYLQTMADYDNGEVPVTPLDENAPHVDTQAMTGAENLIKYKAVQELIASYPTLLRVFVPNHEVDQLVHQATKAQSQNDEFAAQAVFDTKTKAVKEMLGIQNDACARIANNLEELTTELNNLQSEIDGVSNDTGADALKKGGELSKRYEELGLLKNKLVVHMHAAMGLRKQCETMASALSKHIEAVTVHDIRKLHGMIVSLCTAVSNIAFCGLMKAGKSTIVDSIVGQHLSAVRESAMTVLPTRFVHVESRGIGGRRMPQRPVMYIPFAHHLNRLVKAIAEGPPFDQVELRSQVDPHIERLYRRIQESTEDKQLNFKYFYYGAQEIQEIVISLHDILRLAALDAFRQLPSIAQTSLAFITPHSLEDIVTVATEFPILGNQVSMGQVSLIDTPGVDEASVGKLHLVEMIRDVIRISHMASFISKIESIQSIGLQDFLKTVQGDVEPARNRVVFFVSQVESTDEENLSDKRRIALGALGSCNIDIEETSIFPVEAKHRLDAMRMSKHIEQHKQKPAWTDALAKEWSQSAKIGGLKEEKKRALYEKKDKDEIDSLNEDMIESSKMNEALEEMVNKSARTATKLAVEGALEYAQEMIQKINEAASIERNAMSTDNVSLTQIRQQNEGVVAELTALGNKIMAISKARLKEFEDSVQSNFKHVNANVHAMLERHEAPQDRPDDKIYNDVMLTSTGVRELFNTDRAATDAITDASALIEHMAAREVEQWLAGYNKGLNEWTNTFLKDTRTKLEEVIGRFNVDLRAVGGSKGVVPNVRLVVPVVSMPPIDLNMARVQLQARTRSLVVSRQPKEGFQGYNIQAVDTDNKKQFGVRPDVVRYFVEQHVVMLLVNMQKSIQETVRNTVFKQLHGQINEIVKHVQNLQDTLRRSDAQDSMAKAASVMRRNDLDALIAECMDCEKEAAAVQTSLQVWLDGLGLSNLAQLKLSDGNQPEDQN